MSCRHILVETDNAGAVGLFKCIRCGERFAGTAEQVAQYRMLPVGAGLFLELVVFAVVVATFLLFVSQSSSLVRIISLGIVFLASLGQLFASWRWRLGWFGWLLASLFVITLAVGLIVYAVA
jgi:hypothetical protein